MYFGLRGELVAVIRKVWNEYESYNYIKSLESGFLKQISYVKFKYFEPIRIQKLKLQGVHTK